jgi:hypothetical protein
MSEETKIDQQSTIEQENNLVNPFAEESWTDKSVNADQNQQTNFEARTNSKSQTEDEIYDANEYLKMKLGFDDWDDAANQINELKQRRDFAFENEDSKKLFDYVKEQKEDELINFLQEKKKIERLSSAEVKDANTAAEIVKLSMYQKNKDLAQDEIDFLFNEKFQKPAKPEQKYDELDSDYEERVGAWENRVNEIEKRLVIEAKLVKPELEKIKSNFVLPELNPNIQASPEVLEAQKQYMDNFYGSVNDVISSFEGFTATVKDEGADFNVAYIPSYEEKQAVASQLNYFAENNLDANMIFAERWVNDDNTINVKQMTKDLFLLQNEGKITQKYVNEAANRRLSMHLKNQSNIDFNGTTNSGTFAPDNSQSEMDKLAAIMFAK